MALNLEKQLLFYGAYHHDPVNVAIHIIFVPTLLFTGFLLGTNSPAIAAPEWLEVPNLPLNAGTIAAAIYSTVYLLLEPVAGALYAPIVMGMAALGNYLTSTYGQDANNIAIGVHIFSWVVQFIGHGKFEGRAPALLDNLVQALLLAPFFVWFEILFFFGYRPELRKRLDNDIKKEIAAFKKSKKAKGTANGSAKKK